MSDTLKNGYPTTDIEATLAALRRARRRAERIALATGTCIIEAVDGKPVRVPPRPEMPAGAREDEPSWK
jgi:hypothetical protein